MKDKTKVVIKYNGLDLRTPEEMAKILRVVFTMLPEEIDLGDIKLKTIGELSKICANRMVDFLIEKRSRYPKGYWLKVKNELNSNKAHP